ncbi:MAG: transposase [Deltaproteobacteria bacterium]|nr:transposase [Deltaproteobacteria bacterium]MBN2674709.1 transposase [Deltaproteobacteria bacterium]
MARMIRWHKEEFVHFVTNRTEHEMLFLLPTQKINGLILFWLAKAKEKKGKHIKLFSFVFMSNHFHFLLQDPEGELADFMGYFQGNLAKAVNKIHKRKGKFWSREYDDLIVDGEDEFWNRCAYIAANPVAAGLVAKPAMWGGVSSVPYQKNNSIVVGKGLNVSKYNDAKRHGRKVDRNKFEEKFSFALTTPPMLHDKTVNERVKYLSELISNAGRLARKKRGATTSMGMKRVLAQSPFDRPKAPARGARFKIMSFCKARKEELYEKYRLFVSLYRGCCQSLIEYFNDAPNFKGLDLKTTDMAYAKYIQQAPPIIWPDGCYVPTTHKPIGA